MGLFGKKHVWEKIHKGGMRAHYRCWGAECGAAEREGREPDLGNALNSLAEELFSTDPVGLARTQQILTSMRGRYLSETFRSHIGELGDSLNEDQIDKLASCFDPDRLNPVLVICSYIEACHGGAEAARYLAAVISGEAK